MAQVQASGDADLHLACSAVSGSSPNAAVGLHRAAAGLIGDEMRGSHARQQ